MMNEEITVIIDGSGQIEVETNGFTGSVCEKVVEQVVVGLGAQKLINDFVAGIFIVFEHHFDVGDTIEVGSFKGEVIDIGLKTTKIKNWKGEVKIIANGELTQLINFSNYDSSFDVLIDIAYKEDATKVMEMFDIELAEKLKDRPEIVKLPQTVGIASLGSSAVTIKIVGSTKSESYYQLTRDILNIIKNLCDKNNIEIPFTQVVVHQGK
jgi:small conductance mechanosensitive channel